MNRLHEIEERLKAIALELDKATGETLTALENEVSELTEERNRLNAENQKKQELRDKVASGQIGTKAKGANPEENKKERMAQEFMNSKKMSLGVDETRAAILSTGNIAKPTVVNGINDIAGAKVSSIIDLIKVVNCEGMGTNRVAYVDADMAEAGVQTEGSAAGEANPTFNYVDITPTSVAVYSQISKQAKKQTPLNYKAKVTEQALLALRKKAASIATAKLQASALNQVVEAETTTSGSKTYGTITEKTLRKLVLSHGGDEGIGPGVLFLNKTDLLAFGDVRGTNEKKAVYKVTPDTSNPNTGTIEEGGLAVKYCICSGLTACSGTERAAAAGADKATMIYGDPQALELDLFSPYEVKVSEDFAFTSLMDTILGDAEIGADVVVKHGFTAWTIKKATA